MSTMVLLAGNVEFTKAVHSVMSEFFGPDLQEGELAE